MHWARQPREGLLTGGVHADLDPATRAAFSSYLCIRMILSVEKVPSPGLLKTLSESDHMIVIILGLQSSRMHDE